MRFSLGESMPRVNTHRLPRYGGPQTDNSKAEDPALRLFLVLSTLMHVPTLSAPPLPSDSRALREADTIALKTSMAMPYVLPYVRRVAFDWGENTATLNPRKHKVASPVVTRVLAVDFKF